MAPTDTTLNPLLTARETTTPDTPRPPRQRTPGLTPKRMDRHLVSLVDPDSYEAEQYRKLRSLLEEKRVAGRGLVVGVCSPAAGDGKSLTAINLAATLAQAPDARVLLVDADLRRESASLKASLRLGRQEGPGLSDLILDSGLTLQDVARPLTGSNLSVLLTGLRTSGPYELLRSKRFSALVAEAARLYDYVILDAPPVVPVSDCRVISRCVDGFLMVVAAHRTPRGMLEEALDLMGPDRLLGLVFNGSDLMPRRYYGYYGYGKPTAVKSSRSYPARTGRRNGGSPVKLPR